MTNQQLVRSFHEAFGVDSPDKPTMPSDAVRELLVKLLDEEVTELDTAKTIEQVADAIGDILYVTFGAAVAYGIDIQPVFEEIHRSNMSKSWTDEELKEIGSFEVRKSINGRHAVVRQDGKIIKSKSYSPANLKPIIESQCAK